MRIISQRNLSVSAEPQAVVISRTSEQGQYSFKTYLGKHIADMLYVQINLLYITLWVLILLQNTVITAHIELLLFIIHFSEELPCDMSKPSEHFIIFKQKNWRKPLTLNWLLNFHSGSEEKSTD